MNTTTVEIKKDISYSFLQNLEQMDVLRIIRTEDVTEPPKQRLSERFAGCLSNERIDELQQELTKMRDEWNRDIY
jgi:HAMP domain-containing protein